MATTDRIIAIVGIGQELCGDDAVGILTVRTLRHLLQPSDRWFTVEAGPCPENYTGVLFRMRPDVVILIDGGYLNAEPGSIHVLGWEMSSGVSASTHTLPLKILCSYLTQTIQCQILLIVVQVGDTNFGTKISHVVEIAAQQVARTLVEILQGTDNVPGLPVSEDIARLP